MFIAHQGINPQRSQLQGFWHHLPGGLDSAVGGVLTLISKSPTFCRALQTADHFKYFKVLGNVCHNPCVGEGYIGERSPCKG